MKYKGSGRDERASSVANDLSEIFGAPSNDRPPMPSVGAVKPLVNRAKAPKRQRFATLSAAMTGIIVGALAIALPGQRVRQTTPATTTTPPLLVPPAPAELAGYSPPTQIEGKIVRTSIDGRPNFREKVTPQARPVTRAYRTGAVYKTRVHAPRRSEVLAADMRLRRAYALAIRAGVDRRTLVEYRRRWARYRSNEYDRPVRLIGAYADMTDDLHQLARRPADRRTY